MGKEPDLSLTALYTAGAWQAFGLPGMALLESREAARVRRIVDAVLAAVRLVRGGPRLADTLRHRHALLDHLVLASGAPAILELAAGLSPRGIWLSERDLEYVEVDRPEVIAIKRQLLERTQAGRAVLSRPHLRLIGSDVFDCEMEALMPSRKRICVIAEGLLVYLSPADRRRLYEKVAAFLAARGGEFLFDLLPPAEEPPPGLLGRLLAWLMRRLTRGGDFDRTPETREAIRRALLDAGFDRVETYEPATHPDLVPDPGAPSQAVVWRAVCGGRDTA